MIDYFSPPAFWSFRDDRSVDEDLSPVRRRKRGGATPTPVSEEAKFRVHPSDLFIGEPAGCAALCYAANNLLRGRFQITEETDHMSER